MEKNLIIAIVLSILVIVSFQIVSPPSRTTVPPPTPGAVSTPPSTVSPTEEAAPEPMPEPVREEERAVETDHQVIVFSNAGGAIKRILLKDYKANRSNKPFDLVSLEMPTDYIFSLTDPTSTIGFAKMPYTIRQDSNNVLVYTASDNGIEIEKRYIFHKAKYYIELQVFLRNKTSTPKTVSYRMVTGSGIIPAGADEARFVEATAKIDGKQLKYKNPKNQRIINTGKVDWAALKGKYFSLITKPCVATANQFYQKNKSDALVTGVSIEPVTIQPQSTSEQRFVFYAGPSVTKLLEDGNFGFDETVDYGFFGWISVILLAVMRFAFSLFHSWGVSIIFLAVFLNLILFPLTAKSFKSMQKMQALHPQMEKLKAQNKDNPQKLNKEVMELYRKYNINPLSGCLPLLLQMPIFFALYQALIRSIELRGASFLWISDLSLPEGIKLPLSFPIIGDSINILPILMMVAMFVQQKISTKTMGGAITDEQRQQQKIMLVVMPIMFCFIFYNMPSGLVLYWFCNTLLTVAEQYLIFRETAVE